MMHIFHRRPSDYLDNPHTQISFHKRMMRIWMLTAPLMGAIYLASLFAPIRIAVLIIGFINFVTNQISLYANWDTDYGALSAAQSTLVGMEGVQHNHMGRGV